MMAVAETSRSSGKSSTSGATRSTCSKSARCSRRTELQASNRPLAPVPITQKAINSVANIALKTLQDSSTYQNEQSISGFSVSVCLPPLCVGGVPVTGNIQQSEQAFDHKPSVTGKPDEMLPDSEILTNKPGGMVEWKPGASGIPRVFVSNDPIVGKTATTIEQVLPGAVKDVNVPIKNPGIGLSSDADIMLKNGDVIEVKSGGGTGATTQVANQTKIIGDSGEVIVYGPNLKPSVVKGIESSGTKVFKSLDELMSYIKSKGL